MIQILILQFLLVGAAGTQEETAELIGRDMCLACHEVTNGFLSSTHGDAECEGCHGPGSLHMDSGGDTPPTFEGKAPNWVSDQCRSCHGKAEDSLSLFRQGPHSRNQVSCIECHQIHPVKANFGLLKEGPVELCTSCHHSVEAAFRKPFHHPVLEGGMTCLECHNPHSDPEQSFSRLEVFPKNGCVSCHADKRGPFVFEHASSRVNGCMACHQPHGSFNSKLLVRNEVHQLCLECHSMTPNIATAQPPAIHDLRSPRYRNCTTCHREIHGSNVSPAFFR
ncbi:MAG: DmsE family decaheme c-type cytochrome [Acidobacteriota bacterium]|nr:MAG: DmsE family decaheme c-type cytochrome [Acidobacteriota bacterium]